MDGFFAHQLLLVVPLELPRPQTFKPFFTAFHVEPALFDDRPGSVDPVSYFDLGDDLDDFTTKRL